MARSILVLVTAVIVVLYYAPLGNVDFANNWRSGSFGFRLAPFDTVVQEVSDPQLLRDGVRPGDRVDMRVLSQSWSRMSYPRAGTQQTFAFYTRGGTRTETLRAAADPSFDLWQRLGGLLAIVPATVFLIVGFMLVFARPNVMTWTFYVYAAGYFSTKATLGYFSFLDAGAYLALSFLLFTLFGNFAALPLIPFVLRFPNNDMRGWRKKIDPYVWLFLAAAFAAYVWEWFEVVAHGARPDTHGILDNWLPLGAFGISALILIKNFKTAEPETRQRMVWLMGGTLLALVAYAVFFVPDIPAIGFVSPGSDNIRQIIGYVAVLQPVCVAYAVFRHRVIDVNFVVNRAIVYGALSVVLLTVVSLLDWGSSRMVGEYHLATFVEALVTIGVGFILNRFHQTLEDWVDRLLFWRRHQAERYLRRVAAALPFATAQEAIVDGLVREPVEALDLSGAAFYLKRDGGGSFEVAASHRASPTLRALNENHNLVRFLAAEEDVVWLDDLGNVRDGDIGVFVLAVPLLVRHEMIGFTLYGAHRNGAQIDPDEVRLFEELALEAARAYDHVEAVRTRERMEALSLKLQQFEGARS